MRWNPSGRTCSRKRRMNSSASRVMTFPAYALSSADFVWQILRKSSDGEGTAMARNSVQFQKGLSEAEFEALYGTEEKCRAVVMASRWPNGFQCPACGGRGQRQGA